MQLLLRIFRFCNPQRKHRKPSTYALFPGFGYKRGLGNIILPVNYSFNIKELL